MHLIEVALKRFKAPQNQEAARSTIAKHEGISILTRYGNSKVDVP